MDSMLLMAKKKGGVPTPDFLGEVSGNNFITYSTLSQISGLSTSGSAMPEAGWIKLLLDDKIVYVAMRPVRYNITLGEIYSAGLMYGTDDNGLWVPTGSNPRNQKIIHPVKGKNYLVRCMTGQDENPSNSLTTPSDGALLSEFSRIFYPLIVGDTYIDRVYKGKKTGNYSNSSFGFTGTSNGAWSLTSTHIVNPTSGASFGYCRGSGSSVLNGGTTSPASRYTFVGWRPILIEQ